MFVSPASSAVDLEPWQGKLVELAKAEPKISEATWSNDDSFWVLVDDDGSSRDGYAEYVCILANDAGRPDGRFVAVTVWDRASASTSNPKQLGKAYCS